MRLARRCWRLVWRQKILKRTKSLPSIHEYAISLTTAVVAFTKASELELTHSDKKRSTLNGVDNDPARWKSIVRPSPNLESERGSQHVY